MLRAGDVSTQEESAAKKRGMPILPSTKLPDTPLNFQDYVNMVVNVCFEDLEANCMPTLLSIDHTSPDARARSLVFQAWCGAVAMVHDVWTKSFAPKKAKRGKSNKAAVDEDDIDEDAGVEEETRFSVQAQKIYVELLLKRGTGGQHVWDLGTLEETPGLTFGEFLNQMNNIVTNTPPLGCRFWAFMRKEDAVKLDITYDQALYLIIHKDRFMRVRRSALKANAEPIYPDIDPIEWRMASNIYAHVPGLPIIPTDPMQQCFANSQCPYSATAVMSSRTAFLNSNLPKSVHPDFKCPGAYVNKSTGGSSIGLGGYAPEPTSRDMWQPPRQTVFCLDPTIFGRQELGTILAPTTAFFTDFCKEIETRADCAKARAKRLRCPTDAVMEAGADAGRMSPDLDEEAMAAIHHPTVHCMYEAMLMQSGLRNWGVKNYTHILDCFFELREIVERLLNNRKASDEIAVRKCITIQLMNTITFKLADIWRNAADIMNMTDELKAVSLYDAREGKALYDSISRSIEIDPESDHNTFLTWALTSINGPLDIASLHMETLWCIVALPDASRRHLPEDKSGLHLHCVFEGQQSTGKSHVMDLIGTICPNDGLRKVGHATDLSDTHRGVSGDKISLNHEWDMRAWAGKDGKDGETKKVNQNKQLMAEGIKNVNRLKLVKPDPRTGGESRLVPDTWSTWHGEMSINATNKNYKGLAGGAMVSRTRHFPRNRSAEENAETARRKMDTVSPETVTTMEHHIDIFRALHVAARQVWLMVFTGCLPTPTITNTKRVLASVIALVKERHGIVPESIRASERIYIWAQNYVIHNALYKAFLRSDSPFKSFTISPEHAVFLAPLMHDTEDIAALAIWIAADDLYHWYLIKTITLMLRAIPPTVKQYGGDWYDHAGNNIDGMSLDWVRLTNMDIKRFAIELLPYQQPSESNWMTIESIESTLHSLTRATTSSYSWMGTDPVSDMRRRPRKPPVRQRYVSEDRPPGGTKNIISVNWSAVATSGFLNIDKPNCHFLLPVLEQVLNHNRATQRTIVVGCEGVGETFKFTTISVKKGILLDSQGSYDQQVQLEHLSSIGVESMEEAAALIHEIE